MSEPKDSPILILAPGRDSELTCRVLGDVGHACRACRSAEELLALIGEDTGALLVAEEVLWRGLVKPLAMVISAQPAWSDLPVLVVAQSEHVHGRLPGLAALGNVSVLTRPMAMDALLSTAAAALRARRRQFQVRALLHEQQEQSRRKDEFLAMLAHELRNPLAPVRYAAQALRSHELPHERVQMLTALLDRQVGHMARIIDDLLDVSRVTRGVVRLSLSSLDLSELARRCVDAHAPAAAARGVRMLTIAPVPVWVRGDPTRLKQVLENLLDNAVKFSSAGGTVRVRVAAQGAQAELTVEDDGDGIDPALVPHLFEPFMQADRSLDRPHGGLGLGLALVRGLARLHDGDASARSDGPGRGSAFTVRLPRAEAPALVPGDTRPRGADSEGEQRRLRVLVAEDNRDSAESLTLLLELSGHEVAVAYTGDSAIDQARRVNPDVILCDIGLPGIDGYEVARTLRREQAIGRARLIAVTGYGSADDRAAALAAGFDEHLAKPVEPSLLVAALSQPISSAPGGQARSAA